MALENFGIKSGYQSRDTSLYFLDQPLKFNGAIYQPDVYRFAAYLARHFGVKYIIDVGCGKAGKLAALAAEFQIIGIDYGANIDYCREHYAFGEWLAWNLEHNGNLPLDPLVVRQSVIICADVIEHLNNPAHLLHNLYQMLEEAPVALLTTPERDLVRGKDDWGPPANFHHIREWNLIEFQTYIAAQGFNVTFSGLTFNNDVDREKKTALLVIENHHLPPRQAAPPNFKVVAIMNAYNEADVIVPSLQFLIDQGIKVYLIDNWSTDATLDLAKQFTDKGLIGWERFPATGHQPYFNWESQLRRVEEISQQLDADWFIHHDIDEERLAPWVGTSYRDGIYYADCCGFTCLDHTLIEFPPVDNSYSSGKPLSNHFNFFEFGKHPAMFLQIKTWKNTGQKTSLAHLGGHQIQFEQAKVFPYKFLIKHYPIRSQTHGEKKILRERKLRVDPAERSRGWNTHYDFADRTTTFLKLPESLVPYSESAFHRDFLIERLSGIGVVFDGGETAEDIWFVEHFLMSPDSHTLRLKDLYHRQRRLLYELSSQLKSQKEEVANLQTRLAEREKEIAWLKALKFWRVTLVYWTLIAYARRILRIFKKIT